MSRRLPTRRPQALFRGRAQAELERVAPRKRLEHAEDPGKPWTTPLLACDLTGAAAALVLLSCSLACSTATGSMGCSSSKPVADDSAIMRRRARGSMAMVGLKTEVAKDAAQAAEATRVDATNGSVALRLPPGTGLGVRYAYISQRGYYPDAPDKTNQDGVSATERLGGQPGEGASGMVHGACSPWAPPLLVPGYRRSHVALPACIRCFSRCSGAVGAATLVLPACAIWPTRLPGRQPKPKHVSCHDLSSVCCLPACRPAPVLRV